MTHLVNKYFNKSKWLASLNIIESENDFVCKVFILFHKRIQKYSRTWINTPKVNHNLA